MNHRTDSERARRLYFEHLSAILVAKGVDGARVGELIAELDEHVVMSGGDPVAELGSVGELAGALAAAIAPRSPWTWLIGNVLFATAVGAAGASGYALVTGGSPTSEGYRIPVGFVVYIALFVTGMVVVRSTGSSRVVGGSRLEVSHWRVLLPFVVVVAAVQVAMHDLRWTAPGTTVLAMFLVSAPAAVVLGRWSIVRGRIPIDGRLGHLTRLRHGLFGDR